MLGFILYPSFGQDVNSKIKELGLSIRGGANFGIHFKSGTEKSLFRITLHSDNGSFDRSKSESNPNNPSKNNYIGIGLNLGFEKRREVLNNVKFYYGLDLLNSYSRSGWQFPSSMSSSLEWDISTGLGLVLGLNYDINNILTISAGIMPSIRYNYGKNTINGDIQNSKSTETGLDFSLISQGANFAFSFRFGKQN